MNKMKTLWQWMAGNHLFYLGAIISISIATLFSYLVPLVIRITIDSGIGGQPIDAPGFVIKFFNWLGGISSLKRHLWISGILVVTFTFIQGFFTYLKGRWAASASESFARNLRDRLYDHLQRLPIAFHSGAEIGDLIQRCTSDVETIRQFLAIQLVEIGRATIMVILVLPIMLLLDVRMTLVSLAAVPVIFCFAIIFFTKVKANFQLVDETEAELSTVLQENLTGIRVVRAFARQEYEMQKFARKNMEYRDYVYRLILLLAWYWSMSDLLCLAQIAAVLVLGSYWSAAGQLSLGTLVVFITYVGMLLWPIRHMGRILTDLGKAFVSIGRLQDILQQPIEATTEVTLAKMPDLRQQIIFDDVCFAYTDNNLVLRNISFCVKPGQTIALMGPTGAGKSTLVNLLPRLYDHYQGSITIDGCELRDIDRQWLRRQISIVLQEPFLYSKNLRENIRLGNIRANDEEVYSAAKIAAIHNVILRFEKGYETLVGERGVTLSGGQKQRMAIARAMLQNAPLVIFDDSLSAIDTETEVQIQRALRKRRGQATTFVIAHRLSSVAQADFILVLDEGRIVQCGTHEQLVRQTGIYQRVWNIQTSLEDDIQKDLDRKPILSIA